ncbi:NUDIX hydrolase [Lysinibacillus sp. 54212]|uniref:NUDIX hydrolase n=1 Tax=Lysinibacillus sp. 54212 TaxID=3119829 RepID=UPI002FC7AC10
MFIEKVNAKLSEHKSLFIGEDNAFRSAVLIPLVKIEGEWHILFEVRSFTMRKQPGDISFPGGRIDATDSSPLAAALRETHEELGVDPNDVDLVGQLSPYIASPSFVIYPFVVQLEYDKIIHSYNIEEVEEVFTVPIKWLLNYEPYMSLVTVQPVPSPDFPFDKIMNGTAYQWGGRSMEEWFYDYEGYTIWGLTARILKHFIELIK